MRHTATAARGGRASERSVLAVSLLISAAMHVLVVNVRFSVAQPDRVEGGGALVRPRPGETRLLTLASIPFPEPVRPLAPHETDEPTVVPPPETRAPRDGHAFPEPVAEPDASIGAALQPRLSDRRLWRPLKRRRAPAVPLADRVGSVIDSINQERASFHMPESRDMAAWTATTSTRERWGVSPGRIHLGELTIPICGGRFVAADCGFGVTPDLREQYRTAVGRYLEIRAQGERALLEDRARAIRTRRDASRDTLPPRRR